jgi:hypothetical protein
MHDPTAIIPFILTFECNLITSIKAIDSGCQINVMGNQNRLPTTYIQYKSLMPATLIVIWQYPGNPPLALHLNVTSTVRNSPLQSRVSAYPWKVRWQNGSEVFPAQP